jgi:hypothetical protein
MLPTFKRPAGWRSLRPARRRTQLIVPAAATALLLSAATAAAAGTGGAAAHKPAGQKFMAQRMHATTTAVHSAHDIMISHPAAVDQIILRAATAS